MTLSKSQIFFRVINAWFLFSGFLYANLFFHAGDRVPVNIFSSYFFLIILPFIFLVLGVISKIRKRPGIYTFYRKFIEKVSKPFKSLTENMDGSLLKSEFHLNGALFTFGGLFALLLKMTLTDLYFSWNFIFNLSPEFVSFFTSTLSAPWSWLWHGASPALDLIVNTEYIHLTNDLSIEQIKMSRDLEGVGDWRAFFIASYILYGLFPRLVFWAINFRKRKIV